MENQMTNQEIIHAINVLSPMAALPAEKEKLNLHPYIEWDMETKSLASVTVKELIKALYRRVPVETPLETK